MFVGNFELWASGGLTLTDFSVVSSAAYASVHGLLVSVSRVKKGRNSDYFDGQITDGDSKL